MFPFSHGGVEYGAGQCAVGRLCTALECTVLQVWRHGGREAGRAWCSVETDTAGRHRAGLGLYGFCGPDCGAAGISQQEREDTEEILETEDEEDGKEEDEDKSDIVFEERLLPGTLEYPA